MSNYDLGLSWTRINRIQMAWIRPLIYWFIFMSLNRFVLFFLCRDRISGSFFQLFDAFFMGARFDLLVLGFLSIPPVLTLTLLRWMPKDFDGLMTVLCGYFLTCSVLLSLLYFIGVTFFVNVGRHFSWIDLTQSQQIYSQILSFYLSVDGLLVVGIFMAECVGICRITFDIYAKSLQTLQEPMGDLALHESFWTQCLRFFLPILLVGLAARGTVTPHHLEKQHSMISDNAILNKLVLNPPWSFDKQPDAP